MTLTICKCVHCFGEIEFESDRVGESISCPHCASNTILYIPQSHPAPQPPPQSKVALPGETIYFADRDVMVTNTRFVTHGRFFPITAISSVEVQQKQAPGFVIIILVTVAVISGITAFAAFFDQQNYSGGTFGLFVCVLTLTFLYKFEVRPSYTLVASLNNGQNLTLFSRDKNHVNEIATAISNAIAHRG